MSKKYVASNSGGALGDFEEKWHEVLPVGATFYWRMKPPKSHVKVIDAPQYTPGKSAANKAERERAQKELNQAFMDGGIASTNQRTPAPELEPMNAPTVYGLIGNDPVILEDNPSAPSTHVNVRDEHHWTESPMTARGEVPTLNLKEYNVMQNAGINQILQNIGVTVGAINDAVANVDKIIDFFKNMKGNGGIQSALEEMQDMAAKASQKLEQGGNVRGDLETLGSGDPMKVYSGLYARTKTGFKYSLPYMENLNFKTTGGYTEDPQMTGFMGMLNDATEFTAKFAGALAGRFLEPGRYIEKPKNFAFDGRQKSYTVNFPLFNTKNYNEIIKNWQFLFLMTYQNTPGRVTKDVITPPVQYEAYIPGSWYSRYTSITDMTVNFRGARREMDIPVPFLDRNLKDGDNWLLQKRLIKTIIPDCYEVSITLTEIFGETKNSLYNMLAQSIDSRIITGELAPSDPNAAQFSGEFSGDNIFDNNNTGGPDIGGLYS